MSQTNYTWTAPVGVLKVLSEEWGSGAGGYLGGFGGGGGGAYSRRAAMTVIPGNMYNVATGDPGPPNNGGAESTFTAEGGVVANAVGGKASVLGAGGLGGLAADCTGDTSYSGGDGSPSGGGGGGGGGSSAGSSGDGNGGGQPTGGTPVYRGGYGGDGAVNNIAPGSPGGPPGGGGGSSVGDVGAQGGNGAVVLWDDTDGSGWPKFGTPLATFGSPPPNPVNVKARKSVSVM